MKGRVYRIGRVPRMLWPIGERLEPRFGKLSREYKHVVFDKTLLAADPTLEWVTPGHPLFESVREDALARVQDDLRRGAVFYDLNREQPARLDVFAAAVRDGRGNVLHRRLFTVETALDGMLIMRQPTIFLDLTPGDPQGLGNLEGLSANLPGRDQVEVALEPFGQQAFDLRYMGQRPDAFKEEFLRPVYGITYIDDLRPRGERMEG